MKNVTGSLSFRLIAASSVVVAVFITVAGITVYKISQDAIKVGSMEMVRNMGNDVQLLAAKNASLEMVENTLVGLKIKKSGSIWLMDKEGLLLFHPDPVYVEEYVKRNKSFGNVIVSLQYASPRPSGTGMFKEKLADIVAKYEEGFGSYQQFGEAKVVAFRVIKERGWLIGLDEPMATAYSELNRIRKYILYTGVMSALLILAFTWLAIKIIVRPYYREVEDLNVRLQDANRGLTAANDQLEASNKKLTALYRISITMQESLSLEDILDLIISGAQEVLNSDRINIMLPDRGETMLQCRAAIGAGDRQAADVTVPLSSKGGALAASFRRAQVIRVEPGEHIPPTFRLAPPYSEDSFLRSRAFVVLPMVVKSKSVGVIALDNKSSRAPITNDMVNLLQIFANQAAVAVENARLYEELKRNLDELDAKVDQLSVVNQISNTMQKLVKKKEMLGFILRGIKESVGFDLLAVCLLDKHEKVLRGEVGVGLPEDKVAELVVRADRRDNIMVQTVDRGSPMNVVTGKNISLATALTESVENAGLSETTGAAAEGGVLAIGLIPLMVMDEVVGVIVLARTRKNPFITRREMELLMLFANTAGLAVERANLYDNLNRDLERLGITDHVTKLYTMNHGQQQLRNEMVKARESRKPLSVIVSGIDRLSEYNQKFGLELGDRALAETGRMVRMVLAENSFAFRCGGRLICAVLPGRALDDARQTAEQLKNLVGGHLFGGAEGKDDQRLTLSLGLAEYRGQVSIENPSDLVEMARASLQRAETSGGNRIG